ncbi:GNAT family N-acetyltransferase [Mesorhizobium retamae]|uniref:GNAT family N-acetyltransferase n=1 Tax=Mesorhizobium retamae TaxID=2912854 RepID=A0ABS9QH78_9HYPH|nr:GNAT family N-acetyltransferase [Mesorhizobium sp. IRAMC:0171]MCG7506793.1 GNAT family N-acetyltransferase [Mesorhizobium sp. IRAMC:0171]
MQHSPWLDLDYRTLFHLDQNRRIERENDPDRSPGPRFWLAGAAEGNMFGIGADVDDRTAAELESLASAEPGFAHPAAPIHLDRYLETLASNTHNLGLIYELPHALMFPLQARVVTHESEEGRHLLQSFTSYGMPESLAEVGFHSAQDFWAPWCVAIIDDEIASIAFAARLSDVGAEIGVTTMKAFRGQGFGATVTAAWTQLPPLQHRTLFYSTDRGNLSSQRVAARLGLQQRGTTLRVY